MAKITRESLMSHEVYARDRKQFREAVLAHKKHRSVRLGEHLTLLFEDETTIRYQIQEMLRIERVFEQGSIQDEIDAYNPLVPDGSNWKATMLIEYGDVEERRLALVRLKGIEHCMWVQVSGFNRVYAVADEELERENEQKTSAVHFLRFELTDAIKTALERGANLAIGCDHPEYTVTQETLADPVRSSLIKDLE